MTAIHGGAAASSGSLGRRSRTPDAGSVPDGILRCDVGDSLGWRAPGLAFACPRTLDSTLSGSATESRGVSTAYETLLEAALQHVRELQSEGVAFLPVQRETLAGLKRRGVTRSDVSVRTTAASPGKTPLGVGIGRTPGPTLTAGPASFRSVTPLSAASPDRTPMPAAAPPSASAVGSASGSVASLDPTGSGVAASRLSGEVGGVGGVGGGMTGVDRVTAMSALREQAMVCVQCPHLAKARTQVVFGVGSLEAELMFVGEAPGADEDRVGEPFVGRAGQLLTKIIGAMGYTRETVYIANILKCRPDLPPGGRGNRAPRPEEMDTCKPFLMRQIEIIRPKVMVALGNTAVQGLLGVHSTMGSVRGRWQHYRGIPVMPTYHPSYLVRSEDGPDRGYGEKRKTWLDMLLVLERLGRPVTEKMRGYFVRTPGG